MNIGFFGDEGSGKTLLSVFFTVLELRRIPNTIVITNMKDFKFKDRDFNKDFINIMNEIRANRSLLSINRILLIDEINNYIDNRESGTKKNIYITKKLVQIRKFKMTLFYTSVIYNTIDIRLKRITNYVVNCNEYDDTNSVISTDLLDKYGNFIKKMKIHIPKSFYNIYNTFEDIDENVDFIPQKPKSNNKRVNLDDLKEVVIDRT